MKLTIPIHSFVDLITNSSTEIYISADSTTVAAVEKMVDGILAAGGSTKKAAELFTFALDEEDSKLVVKARDPKDSDTATTLSSLTSLFDINAEYNG